MIGSAVVAQVSETTKITTSSAGSARNPIIISRRAPMRAEGCAHVHGGQGQKYPRCRQQADQRDRVGGLGERQAGRDRRDDRRRGHHGAEDHVGREPEQPRGVLGDHRILVEQLADFAVRLQKAGRGLVLQPRAALIHPAAKRRRHGQRNRYSRHLHDPVEYAHSASANKTTSVTKL